MQTLKIGTCSWKYESWQGLVYPETGDFNYLQEYSKHYDTVEIDQWFWSLFKNNTVVLPKASVVKDYAASVPPGFVFSIKVPNSITLTHMYNKQNNAPLSANPYFLSSELMEKFLRTIEPLREHIGPLMFQFEYLNKNKMAGLKVFLEKFEVFHQSRPEGYQYCVEIRNPNYLTNDYFDFLVGHKLGHVFLQGYYMPSIFELYEKFKNKINSLVVIRLHGGDRKDIEERTKNIWNEIVDPRGDELAKLGGMVQDLREKDHRVFINVNNHYEGSAPKTIEKIKALLKMGV
jgi:uncharacterized protein YecE (DUF72 family)